jgi:hypothetical protein
LVSVAFFLFFGTPDSYALVVDVAQESSPGAGDFDSNILGQIESFSTPLTIADFLRLV